MNCVKKYTRPNPARVLLLLIAIAPLLAGCDTLQFYHQAVWGQWQLLHARTSLSDIDAQQTHSPEVRERLQLARQILQFGEDQMGLVADGRYTSYVHLQRKYVVWNVFASAPYELDGRQWCYPVVGCAPYRGYFSETAAQQAAQRFVEKGLETYVGGVPAYSTLGWFEDPLLSTFILWPEPDLANLLLHEMSHSKVWVNGDVAFNESFAEFVGNRGSRAWLEHQGKEDAWQAWIQRRGAWRSFRAFAVQAKNHLQTVYALPLDESTRQHRKVDAIAEIQACYQAHRQSLGGGRYDQLMAKRFNNAFLVSVSTYADWLPGFAALFASVDGQWPTFYLAVDELAALRPEARAAELTALSKPPQALIKPPQALTQQQIGERADDDNADEVHCQAFARHGAYGEAAG